MKIYCDIGNSNIKFFLKEENKLSSLPTKEFNNLDDLKKMDIFNSGILIDKLIFCSVVPDKTLLVKQMCEAIKLDYTEITYQDINLKCVENLQKEKVGIDILLNAWYCQKKDTNCIVANFGTATTICYVKEGEFNGYLILPSFASSLNALVDSTSLVKTEQVIKQTKTFGLNTNEAVSFGIVNAPIALVNELANLFPQTTLFISGRDIENLFANKSCTYIDEITINALAHFF